MRRRNRGLARPSVQARWKNIGVLGLGFIPNQHKLKSTNKRDQAAYRSGTGEARIRETKQPIDPVLTPSPEIGMKPAPGQLEIKDTKTK
jgi:hypothetical protein